MTGMKAMRAAGVLFALLVLAVPTVQASEARQDFFSQSTTYVVPFYDISANHASFLILHSALKAGGAFVTVLFYDQTCTKRADQFISLTPADTAVLSVAALNPSAPTQGAILLSAANFDEQIFASILNVDFANGTSTLLNAIPTHFESADAIPGGGWQVYTRGSAVLTFGPKEAAPFSTTLTMSCPRTDAVGTLGGDMLSVDENGFFDFEPAAGTRTTVLDIFVFDLDEKFLGSIHNVTCRCFERKALKDWVPQALTSDVAVYFHGVQDNTGADRSIAGFYETVASVGTTKFYWSSYLNHQPSAP